MATEMIPCRGCQKEIHKTAATCPHCGAPQRTKRYKSKIAAGVLGIVLGGLGIHRFYLGQWWGIFYLLFVWTWIPGIVALVEGIVFLCTNDEKWDRKHNDGIPGTGESSVGVVVAVVAGVFVFIVAIGILAAIALPAYQDYTIRARISEAMLATSQCRTAVSKIYQEGTASVAANGWGCEDSRGPFNQYVQSITTDANGVITIGTTGLAALGGAANKTVMLTPTDAAGAALVYAAKPNVQVDRFKCAGGSVPPKYLPGSCR